MFEQLSHNLFLLYGIGALVLYIITVLMVQRRHRFSAAIIVVLFAGTLISGHEVVFNLMGKPRYSDIYFLTQREPDRVVVLGMKQVPGDAIYLLLNEKNVEEPYFVEWPWDDAKAEQLSKAMQESIETYGRPDGFEIEMKGKSKGRMLGLPFDSSLDTEPLNIHPLPQPALDKGKN